MFQWDPGDGSDIVEGQDGTDTLLFNGANIGEKIDISANGNRARLFRDVGNVTMDLGGIEHIQLNMLGGPDTITVNDLSGTDVSQVAIDLSAQAGTGTGDGAADTVITNGTANNDQISVATSGNSIVVNGSGGAGHGFTAPNPPMTRSSSTVSPVTTPSMLRSSTQVRSTSRSTVAPAMTRIIGSKGDDVVIGGQGNDVASLGAGNDTFVWNPGDGSDIVEGQAGADTLQFNGSNIGENIDISANGSRIRLSRDIGSITMDVNGTETINVRALGGEDTITVNDLTGTDVTNVNVDLGVTRRAVPTIRRTRSSSTRPTAMTRSQSPATTVW